MQNNTQNIHFPKKIWIFVKESMFITPNWYYIYSAAWKFVNPLKIFYISA